MVVIPVEKKIEWSRPPAVLFSLVIINILFFAFYQSGDDDLLDRAVEIYTDEQFDQLEYPAYKAYQEQRDPDSKIEKDDQFLVYYMLTDKEFREFLEQNQDQYIDLRKQRRWQRSMSEVDRILKEYEDRQLSLSTDKPTFVTLFTHQFLHADFSHLFGNMVFLLLTGFAVEAALGHARFLIYYLISGLGAGLLFTFTHSLSGGASTNLVGASGAISGVMAMYLALFKFRKIEFFYWVFVFTGYFRAAAVIILPAYILKELYMLFFTEGANVAYTAHIGGFLAGAALVLATQLLANQKIDDSYIEGEEEIQDPYLIALSGLYKNIAECDFKKSWKQLGVIKKQHPGKPELEDIQLNLLYALNKDKAQEFLLNKLVQEKVTPHQAHALTTLWSNLQDPKKAEFSFAQLNGFARHALTADMPQISERIFARLRKDKSAVDELAVLARKIGFYYDALEQGELAQQYRSAAQDIMQATQT